MADYGTENVKCPFYCSKQNDNYRIKCEGVVKGTTTQLTFVGSKNKYLREYCCVDYKQCRIYKMLITKYDNN